jgi:hypothetical protein
MWKKKNKIQPQEKSEFFDLEVETNSNGRNLMKIQTDLSDSDPAYSENISELSIPDEDLIGWNDSKWQVKVLKPYCDSMITNSYLDCQLTMLKYIETKILQTD